ncbi:MAG: biotin--[acetyl-CoA-carboxylase] ligase [Proteobacteria bacterium]|nr:biotin--[acetyl-CoA-carboxylase] ligase [Pseudomonadota bacterium]MBU1639309.1 biotin--[acetyl-CoA-carboxylase] ligase [Pseudomonadota bacterium]
MGVVSFPSPDLLTSYIAQQEMARRSAGFSLPAHDIMRYGAIVASHIQSYSSLPRAMNEVRQQIQATAKNKHSFASGSVLFAETLTGGKGRFKRPWHAPEGGLWLVVALFNQWLPQTTQLLPLVAGVSACETVREFGLDAELKWVNDVLVGGKKICGILCETFICPESSEEYILVGIGLNVNNTSFPDDLTPLATSMKTSAGHDFDLGLVALDLLAKLRWNIGLLTYEEEELESDHGTFMASYRALCRSCQRRVSWGFDVQNNAQYEATVRAIAEDGGIVLHHLQDDVEVVEHGGEIIYLD